MPTIEVTQEQLDALTRGENIVLMPPKRSTVRAYVVTMENGNRYYVKTANEPKEGRQWATLNGESGILIDKGPHTSPLGFVQRGIGGPVKRVVEIV